jgi:hypothetical protein
MSRDDGPCSPEEAAFELGHHVGQGERCTDCGELLADHGHRETPSGLDLACPV